MKELAQQWLEVSARYVALSRRERGLIAAALVFGPIFAVHALFLDPAMGRNQSLHRLIAQQSNELAGIQAQVAGLQVQVRQDPDAARKTELAKLRQDLDAAGERLNQLPDSLLPPREMTAFLEGLLARNPALRLVSLKTLPPESVLQAAEKPAEKGAEKSPGKAAGTLPRAGTDAGAEVYRHGVEICLEGKYPDLLAYLAQLEASQKKVLWGGLQLSVAEYPKSVLTLLVYTLSPEKTWLVL